MESINDKIHSFREALRTFLASQLSYPDDSRDARVMIVGQMESLVGLAVFAEGIPEEVLQDLLHQVYRCAAGECDHASCELRDRQMAATAREAREQIDIMRSKENRA